MKIIVMTVGFCETNCYLLINEETKEAVLIDPGDGEEEILGQLEKEAVLPQAVLLTHGHFDHMLGVKALKARYGMPVYAGADEQAVLGDGRLNQTGQFGRPETLSADILLKDGAVFEAAGFRFEAIETPGHTQGGMCFYLKDEKLLFSGDTLMCGSYGRTDFPTGDFRALRRSVTEKIFILPEDTVVCPGHMDTTTIGQEKRTNPILYGM